MRIQERIYTPGLNAIERQRTPNELQTNSRRMRMRAAVTTFRRRRRIFVILWGGAVSLEHADNLAKEAFLFTGLFFGLDPRGRLRVPVRGGRRQRFLGISAKHAGEEPLHTAALVAGVSRLGAGDEGTRVSVWTGRSCQAVGDFVELYIHYPFRLREGLHVRILWQHNRFLPQPAPHD